MTDVDLEARLVIARSDCRQLRDHLDAAFADIWFRLEAHGPSMVVTHQPVAPKNPGGAGPAAVESL